MPLDPCNPCACNADDLARSAESYKAAHLRILCQILDALGEPSPEVCDCPLTDAELRATPVVVSDGGGSLTTDPGTGWVDAPLVGADLTGLHGLPTMVDDGTTHAAWMTQPLTSAQFTAGFPASIAVTGTFWQATQPVSGTVAVSNFPASQAVTGTFWQATQPVSGTLTVSGDMVTFTPTRPSANTATSTSLIAANANRKKGSYMQNNTSTTWWLQYAAAAVSGQGVQLMPKQIFVFNTTQEIRGIQSSGGALNLDVFEAT